MKIAVAQVGEDFARWCIPCLL